MDKDKRLVEAPVGRDWLWVKLDLDLVGRAMLSSVQFSCSAISNYLWPHGLQHPMLPCPSPTPGACSNSCPLSRWCHPISSSCLPFSSHFQYCPVWGSFTMSQFFASGGQSIRVSASWTAGISLLSKGLSRVFPPPQFKSINSSVLKFLYSPTLTSKHDYWKNHSFDWMDLCWQRIVSAF